MKKCVCVFAAHPDDEILGCGGTIAWHRSQGDDVHVIIMGEGITSRGEERDVIANENALNHLVSIAEEANKVIGSSSLTMLKFPDNRMDSLPLIDIVKSVECSIEKFQPSIVYTHHASDVNIDHQKTHEAVIVACRPQPGHVVKQICCFEVMSSTEWQPPSSKRSFQPNWFVSVGSLIEKKLAALAVYETEMRAWPHARSIDAVVALAKYRGACLGVDAAEAFELARCLRG